MSCLEKRHLSHRMGSMLHHRFPNGFTDLFMDETDREVSTLTDRAFRSLCIGDDAVYSDDFLYGYSPYSCLKPLAGEPLKKNNPKESKKAGHHKPDKSDAQPWKQQQQKNISHMSSFLKVLSAAEESCERMLITNGDATDCNVESWDKSALRSIERELSEFSSDYHTSLTDGQYRNHLPRQSGSSSSNKKSKDTSLPSGKSARNKNGKSAVKLRKLNIKNFFLHSEFSPFQTWTDFNRYPFGQENTVTNILSTDNIPKWYDLPFYKELTEAHRKQTLHPEESTTCQKEAVEPFDAKVTKPIPPPPPPKVLPKPCAPSTEKRCSSDGRDGHAAPWRRNRSRAKSAVPVNQTGPGLAPQECNSKAMNESLFLSKKESKSIDVKAIEEVSSLASTPFSICQLMTPVILSRQPTETSEVLQAVLSPSVLDLLGRPHSEAKGTPEPPIKRESYKSLASSILFNLKDNRKRVKSRYSPPKFKTSEPSEGGSQSPQTEIVNQAASESSGSGLNTPGILKDGQPVFSPTSESITSPNVDNTNPKIDKPLLEDYLLSNLLQSKRDIGEENPISPFILSKKNKSPMSKKQNYPSLSLYRKASPVDSDMKYLQVPLSTSAKNDPSTETKNRALPPNALPTNTGLSPSTLNVIKDYSPIISPHMLENWDLSSEGKRPPNVPEKTKWVVKDSKDKDFTTCEAPEENEAGGQTITTMNLIRAAREAINAAKNKAQSASYPDSIDKQMTDPEGQKETAQKVSDKMFRSKREGSITENNVLSQNDASSTTIASKSSNISKDPPPVPKRNFGKSDTQTSHDKQHRLEAETICNEDCIDDKLDLQLKEQGKLKHVFSARQNNYIKHQRYSEVDDKQAKENEQNNFNVSTEREGDNEIMSSGEIRDSEHIFNDLQALKELEKVRLGDRTLDNTQSKLEIVNIDEEAKAKNDLISRELRNIKRGMMSMRGNTLAKRKIFTKQKKEQSKPEAFTKLDGNIIVNKALINDNYDKAKMALEEVISEREKRRKKFTEQDPVPITEENVSNKKSDTKVKEANKAIKDNMKELREEQAIITTKMKERDLTASLGGSKDNNLRKSSAETNSRPGETHGLLASMNTISNELNPLLQFKHAKGTLADDQIQNTEINLRENSKSSAESGKYVMNERENKQFDTPRVPPRNKKGGNKRDGSITEERNAEEDIAYSKDEHFENHEEQINLMRISLENEDAPARRRETSTYKEKQDDSINANLKSNKASALCSSPNLNQNKNIAKSFQTNMSHTDANAQQVQKKKRKAPLKPDHLIFTDDNMTKSLKTEAEQNEIGNEDVNVDTDIFCEVPQSMVSPLLLVNGISVTQSPPDQASLSSKSSYFSAESALQRNTETESNVYHSLENSPLETEELDGQGQTVLQKDLNRADVPFYSLRGHERELENIKQQIKSPQEEPEDNRENVTTSHEESDSAMSPDSFSLGLGIPVLFKVKDNTFNNKIKKPAAFWSPRGSLVGPEHMEEELHPGKENTDFLVISETPTNNRTATPTEIFKPEEISSSQIRPLLLSPSNTQDENPKKAQHGGFLTVPQEEDKLFRITPSSEGRESFANSTTDTADEATISAGVLVEGERTNAPSEHSGSICSGSDNQTGQPKPPAVLPKSEKAVQKAIKLTHRRIRKEEAQNSSHKSSQSSSKHRTDRPKSDKSEQKTSSSAKTNRNSEKKRRERIENHHNKSQHSNENTTQKEELQNHKENPLPTRAEKRQNRESVERTQSKEDTPDVNLERQGRISDRHVQDKPEQKHYSTDRIISNVPVYRSHTDERPMLDRSFHRSQSIDRYLGGKAERRLSADASVSEKLEPRTQRIEKSIVHELQQRGRAKDKASRGNLLRRSHSIDAYSIEAPSLSRQSSHTSQFSRQSSIEPTIVTQSFPMTQRKLLQDPDSGQYFFVDLPVQVKTKTFIDPNTGSYVQLPVQPPDGGVPQAPQVEVLSPPVVVYHSFMPVPLSPMAQSTTIHAPYRERDDTKQRHLQRARQMLCKEGHPYLDPTFGQQDHMFGEFLGTEELDCPS